VVASVPVGYAFCRLVEQRFAGGARPAAPARRAESLPTPAAA